MRKARWTWPVALALLLGAARAASADECWLQTPPGYQGIGGTSRLGPYADWYAANRVNQEYFQGQGTISCRRDGGDPPQQFRYGAAKIHNRTALTLTFSVRTKPNGGWQQVTVRPGGWHWWWQECPCRFHATWDGSTAPGNQAVTREVNWYGYATKPSDGDARDWQFVQRGSAIELVLGSDAPMPSVAPPSQQPAPLTIVSVMGGGEGQANAAEFREATSASGTWEMSFLPRVDGQIPTLSGGWQMQWLRIEGRRDDPYRTEVWNLSMSGMYGAGWRDQTVNVRIVGGAGTATFVSTLVPGQPQAGTIRLNVSIQFVGQTVRLGFTRAV